MRTYIPGEKPGTIQQFHDRAFALDLAARLGRNSEAVIPHPAELTGWAVICSEEDAARIRAARRGEPEMRTTVAPGGPVALRGGIPWDLLRPEAAE